MQRVVIIGAGGHAQVVADILMLLNDNGMPVQAIGYVDDDPQLHGTTRLGLPVLGALHDLPTIEHDAVIIGIGNNHIRRKIYEMLGAQGEHFAIAQHPSAVIARDVILASGTVVCAGAIVNIGATIGANVILNTACSIDHHSMIGNHGHIAPGAHLGGDVVVGRGALIGIGATVHPQRQVGAWTVIGAGSVVIGNIPDDSVAMGVPARVVDYKTER
jgi:acetyltransferase EpsM